jgi:RNA polymerase sigma-70 factor (ECF subfamily)
MENDKYYIEKIKQGEKQYFSYIIDNYKKIAFTLALRLVKIRDVAEDLTQDAFIKIYINIGVFDYRVKFSTWVYRIVYNTCIDYLRKENVQFERIDEENYRSEFITEDKIDFDSEYKSKIIQNAILSLPGDYGFIMTLYYFEEMNTKEISNVTGQSKDNIKVKLHRGRKLLEIELRKKYKNELVHLV